MKGGESQGGAKGELRERTRECFPLQFPFKQRHSGIFKGEDEKVAFILQQAPLNENSATIKGRNC